MHTFILSLMFALLLGAPSLVGAQSQGNSSGAGDQDRDQTQDRDQIQDPSTHDGDEPIQDRDQTQDQTRDQDQIRLTSTTSTTGVGQNTQAQNRVQLNLQATTTPAWNAEQLRQTIQERERELNQEASSTDPRYQQIIRNENQVRLAVHALLASEQVFGNIGSRVSEIAREFNNSVQATVNAEAQVQSRGFLSKLFFGGDREAGLVLEQEVTRNRERIQELTRLLEVSGLSEDFRVQLETQLRVMEQEQDRLEQLAEREQGLWGIFSWRF